MKKRKHNEEQSMEILKIISFLEKGGQINNPFIKLFGDQISYLVSESSNEESSICFVISSGEFCSLSLF